MIVNLPWPKNVTLGNGKAIREAREAYGQLSEDQQALVLDENLNKLVNLEKSIIELRKATDKANEAIANLPVPRKIARGDAKAIAGARAAVEALWALDAKSEVVGLEKLEAAEVRIADIQAAENVADMIEKIPSAKNLTLENKKMIGSVRKAYDGLTKEAKELVENFDELEKAERKILNLEAEKKEDEEAAQKVTNLIERLRGLNKITLRDKAEIAAARSAYDALTEGQKNLVLLKNLNKLRSSEEKIEGLEANLREYKRVLASVVEEDHTEKSWKAYQVVVKANGATEDNTQEEVNASTERILEAQKSLVTSDKGKARNVDKMIENLPGAEDVVLKNKEAVEAARAAYNGLSTYAEDLVARENVSKLKAVEKKLDQLEEATKAANKAITEIGGLPALANISRENINAVGKARAAVEALWALNPKAAVEGLNTLEAAELKIADFQAATSVNARIKALPLLKEVNLKDEKMIKEVKEVRSAYAGLSKRAETIIEDLNKLEEIEEKIINLQVKERKDIEAAEGVTNLIEKLRGFDKLTLRDKAEIAAASLAYRNLEPQQKDLVSLKNATRLKNAEEKIENLEANLREYKRVLASVVEEDYTAKSWNAYQVIVNANPATVDNTQEEVNSSTENILAAQKNLETTEKGRARIVERMIENLPGAGALTLKNKEAVEAARTAYDKLSIDAEKLVERENVDKLKNLEKKIEQLEIAIAAVNEAIGALPGTISLGDANKVAKARAAVNALLALDPTAKITGLNALEAAEVKIADFQAAAEVNKMIEALPWAADLVLADKPAVVAARAAYRELSEGAKESVTPANLNGLLNREKKIKNLEVDLVAANKVIEKIKALAWDKKISLEDKAAIVKVRADYGALSPEAKDLVTNLDGLVKREAKIKELEAIAAVKLALAALPETVSLADEGLVVAARAAVDALWAIDPDLAVEGIDKLVAAEKRIINLKKAELTEAELVATVNDANLDNIDEALKLLGYEDYDNISNRIKSKEISQLFFSRHEDTVFTTKAEVETKLGKIIVEYNILIKDVNEAKNIEGSKNALQGIVDVKKFTLTNLKDPVSPAMAEAFYKKIKKTGFEGFKTVKEIDAVATLSQEELINASMGMHKGNINLNPRGTGNINYGPAVGTRTIEGNVTIAGDGTGSIDIRNLVIKGNLTVNTPNASVTNAATVYGTTTITDVASSTWNEKANGNKIVVNDKNGITLYIAAGSTVESLELNGETTLIIGSGVTFTKPVAINAKTTIISQVEFAAVIKDGVKVIFKNDKDDKGTEIVGNGTGENIRSQAAVINVNKMIEALPLAKDLVLEDKAAIAAARETYKALSAAEKALVTDLDKLEKVENRIKKLLADDTAAKKVIEAIKKLPWDQDINLRDGNNIEAARAAYDSLTAAQKELVTNLDGLVKREEKIIELKANLRAETVNEMIKYLPLAKDVSLKDQGNIEEARAAYDALSRLAKMSVPEANVDKLVAVEKKMKTLKEARYEANEAISNLPEVITIEDAKSVAGARAAVEALLALDPAAKLAGIGTLEAAEVKIADFQAAAEVNKMIEALPLAKDLVPADKAAIERARSSYQALSAGAKASVEAENLEELVKVEKRIKALLAEEKANIEAAQKVTDLIEGLKAIKNLTIGDKADVEAARAAYDALSEDQIKRVSPDNLKRLKNAESRIKELEADLTAYNKALGAVEEEDYTKASWKAYKKIVDANLVTVDDTQDDVDSARAAIVAAQKDLVTKDKATAEAVEAMIGKLPLAADLVVGDKADVEAARTAYNALTKEAKKLVKNLEGLENREARIQKLQARLTIKTVKDIEDIEVGFGGEYTLPKEIQAILSDDTPILVPVKWNQIEVDVNKAGSYQVKGTLHPSDLEAVAETDKKATVNVVVKAADLTAYNAALALAKDGYTEKSWAVYKALVAENSVTVKNTQKEIDAASAAILAAQKDLVTEAEEAAEVDKMIKDLPWAGVVTLEDKAAIGAAKVAYDALSDIAKGLVKTPNKLIDGVKKIADLEADKAAADKVSKSISGLAWDEKISLEDKAAIVKVRADYGALSPEAKKLVTNLDGLVKREAKIKELEAIAAVKLALAALPDKVSLTDKPAVEAARAAVDALLAIDPDLAVEGLDKLEAAEKRIVNLEKAAATEAALVLAVNEAGLDNMDEALDALNYEDYDNISNAIKSKEISQLFFSRYEATVFTTKAEVETKLAKIIVEYNILIKDVNEAKNIEGSRKALQAIVDVSGFTLTNLKGTVYPVMAEAFYNKIKKTGFEGFKTVKEIDAVATLSQEELINASTGTHKGNIKLNPRGTGNINYGPAVGTRTINGDVTIAGDGTGNIDIRNLVITGSLIVNTPNATVTNTATAVTIDIKDVASSTWYQNADGKTIIVNDKTGIRLYIADKTRVENLILNEGTTLILGAGVTFTNPVVINANSTIISPVEFTAVIKNGVKVVFKKDKDDKGTEIEGNGKEEDIRSQAAVINVNNMIEALPLAKDIALKDQAAVVAARESYKALSDAEKVLVTGLNKLIAVENKIKSLLAEEKANNEAAQVVIALIDGLSNPDEIVLGDKADIVAARAAYDSLTKEQKALLAAGKLKKLEKVEASIGVLEAEEVNKMIVKIAWAKDVTLANEDEIVAARTAYEALSSEAKLLVKEENTNKLKNIEKKIADLNEATEAVKAAIAAIPEDLTLESAALVAKARAAVKTLRGLDPEALVEGIETLKAAEKKIADLKAAATALEKARVAVEETMAVLPAEVKLEDEGLVVAARAAVEALLKLDPAAVEGLDGLVAAEAKIIDLKAVKIVDELIEGLPKIKKITLANKVEVEAAREAYETLTEGQKSLVANPQKLVDTETKIADLKAATKAVKTAMAALPAEVKLEDEGLVVAARAAVEALLKLDPAAEVKDLDKLVAAEERIAELKSAAKEAALLAGVNEADLENMNEALYALEYENYDNISNAIKRKEISQLFFSKHGATEFTATTDIKTELEIAIVDYNKLIKDVNDIAKISDAEKALQAIVDVKEFTLTNLKDPVTFVVGEAFYNKMQKIGFEAFKTIEGIDAAANLSQEELINASKGKYKGNLELNPSGTGDIKYGPEAGARTIDGNVTIAGDLTGSIDLRNLTITGDLTVDTPNATINNSAVVEGTIFVINVASSTWNENVSGNKIVINDKNGMTIYIADNTVVDSLVLEEGATLILGAGVIFTNPVVIKANSTIISPDTFLVVIEDGVKVVFKDDEEDEGTEIVGDESEEEVDIKAQLAASEVDNLIAGFKADQTDISEAYIAKVKAARKAYDALKEEAKALVKEGNLKKLQAAELKIAEARLKVIFDVKGASVKDGVETELTVKKGTQVKLLTYLDIEKEGYTLKGWLNTTTNEEITAFGPSVEITEDVRYEAIWQETRGKLQMHVYSDKPGDKVPSQINLVHTDGSKTPMTSNQYGPSYRTWDTDRSLKNGEYTFEFIGLKENLKITMEGSNISESLSTVTPQEGSEKTAYKVNLKFKDNDVVAFTRVKMTFEVDQDILAAAVNAVNTAEGELALWKALNSSVFEGVAVEANIDGYKPEFGKGKTQFATAKEIQEKIKEINQKIIDDTKFDVLKEDLERDYPNQAKVNTILTKEFVDADIDNISLYMDSIFTKKGKVKNKIASLEDLERTIKLANAIRIAEDGIENLPKIKDIKNSVEDKKAIADVKALIEVVKGLDKDAKVEGEEKIAELEDRIAELIALEIAEEAVEKAETTKTREDYQAALGLVNPLKTSDEKDDLKDRLAAVLEAIELAEASQALEEYEAKVDTKEKVLELVNDDDLRNRVSATKTPAFNKIQLVKEGKQELLDRLDIAHNKLITATAVKALQNASKDLTVENLDNAKIKLSNAKTNVKNLGDVEIKTALNELIGIEEEKMLVLENDIAAAKNVDTLISKFSSTETNISKDYMANVEAARDAYDALNAEAKALVIKKNLEKLQAAEVKIVEAAAVKALNEATTQIKLWQALGNKFFKDLAIEDNIVEYEKVFGKENTQFATVEEIREKLKEINKSIADQSKFEKIKADLEEAYANQVKVFNILDKNFEKANSDYIVDYMEDIFNEEGKVTLASLEKIQEAISSVNSAKEIAAVKQLIEDMTVTKNLTLKDKEEIVEVRAAYDSLTDIQKKSVVKYTWLTNNENKIIFLETEVALLPAVNNAGSTPEMETALQAIVDALQAIVDEYDNGSKIFELTNLSDSVTTDEANAVLAKKAESGFKAFKTIKEIDAAATL